MKKITIEDIYYEFFDSIYSFCFYSTNKKEEAEDITQDTFLKAMKKLHTLKDPDKVKAWMFSIARTTIIDYHRRKKLKQFISGEYIFKKFKSQEYTPEEAMIQSNNLELVKRAIGMLNRNQREIFLVRTVHELSIQETAVVMGCSEGKVRVEHHRSIKRVQQIISDLSREDEIYESSQI